MVKLSIHRLNVPLHDSNAVNLETIDLVGKTPKKLWISWGSTIHRRCNLPTHEYVTTCYGKSSEKDGWLSF